MISIYALVEPGAATVRYVGQTGFPVEARRDQHVYTRRKRKGDVGRWLRHLHDAGLKPGVVLLELISGRECLTEREGYWSEVHRETTYFSDEKCPANQIARFMSET